MKAELKIFVWLATLIVLSGALSIAGQQSKSGKRNVLLIVTDDEGFDIGAYGNSVIRTPNQDRLAQEGVRFTNAFTGVSSCSPSRAVIYSGYYAHTNGMYGLAHGANNQNSLPTIQSVPQILSQNGYRTALIGKNHVNPASVYPFDYLVTDGLKSNRDGKKMAEKAREFLSADADKPFFMVMAYMDPHRGGIGKNFGNYETYEGINKNTYQPDKVVVPPFLPDTPEVRDDLSNYYQAIDRLDQGIGMLLKVLSESGHLDDTLIILASDNGIPFPNAKTNLYDPGIRLPFIVRLPDRRLEGQVNNAMVSYVDIAPTVYEWTKIKPPGDLPGRSLLPLFYGTGEQQKKENESRETIFASHVFHEISSYYPMRAIRTRRFKLIWNLAYQLPYPISEDIKNSPTWKSIVDRKMKFIGKRPLIDYLNRPEFELYDLEKDPSEVVNQARNPKYKSVFNEMKNRLEKMMRETKDPWWQSKTTEQGGI